MALCSFASGCIQKPIKHSHRPVEIIYTQKTKQRNTRQTSVTIETGHSGHIEDLLIKPPWKYYSLRTLKAETQTVTTLQEQDTHHSTTNN